ncbi:hypothetical protein K2Z84_13680 [Candidatus Binatia bacterium]|jgi:hypothetical protein|nr:hypothetical protein [Candidatus Binatia bacterium]
MRTSVEALRTTVVLGIALAWTPVSASGAQGQVSLHGSFLRGQTSTAGYFTGPGGSDLAATITFSS